MLKYVSYGAEIAQVVERGPEKPGVTSASLVLGTIFMHSMILSDL